MGVLKILKKSFQLITWNFRVVGKLMILLFSLHVASISMLNFVFWGSLSLQEVTFDFDSEGLKGAEITALTINFLVTLVSNMWIAVVWHRYILLEETFHGWFPKWNSALIVSYFIQWLKMGLIAFGLIILVILVAVMGGRFLGVWASQLLPLVLGITAFYLFWRVCLVLPAASVGKKMPILEAWEITAAFRGTIFLIALCVFLLGPISLAVVGSLGAYEAVFALEIVLNLFLFLWGVAVVTTLYGVAVEGRDIEGN